MPLLRIPQPYDFELSTERFRAFGVDLANVWHEGGLHRVIAGREVRIESTGGGVLVDPLDDEIEPAVRTLLGFPFDLEAFRTWAAGTDPVLARLAVLLEGLRPPLSPDPFETLVSAISAQQVSLFAAFAVRSRFVERFGERFGHACSFPTRERVAAASEDQLFALGFSRRKAEYVLGVARAELDYRGGEGVSIEEVRTLGTRFAPFQNLTAHYLLTGSRVARP